MAIETIYLSQKAKDRLTKLKRATGIQYWNILCRWAFCVSLADKTAPSAVSISNDHAIEMTWKVFGGQGQEVYSALIIERCRQDGLSLDNETLSQQMRYHLHRGIGQMVDRLNSKKIDELFNLRGAPNIRTR